MPFHAQLSFKPLMHRRPRSSWLAQHLLAHFRVHAEMHAPVLFKNKLIKLQAAVADLLRCLEIGEPVDVEIRSMAESVSGVWHAANRGVHLRISIAAGDLDRLFE